MKLPRFSLQTLLVVVVVAASMTLAWISDSRRREAERTVRMLESGRKIRAEQEIVILNMQLEAARDFARRKGFSDEMDRVLFKTAEAK
jgi:hypothetical protein